MKKQIFSAITSVVIVASLTGISNVTQAQSALNEKTPEVKYLGTSDDAVLFDVALENPGGNKFLITVIDEDGSTLYTETYSDRRFDKRFKLPKNDHNKITFVIRNFKDIDVKQSFEINTRFVEDVVVTKTH